MKPLQGVLGIIAFLYFLQAAPSLLYRTKQSLHSALESKTYIACYKTKTNFYNELKTVKQLQSWFASSEIHALFVLIQKNSSSQHIKNLLLNLQSLKKEHPKPIIMYIEDETVCKTLSQTPVVADYIVTTPFTNTATNNALETTNQQVGIFKNNNQFGTIYDCILWMQKRLNAEKPITFVYPNKPSTWQLVYKYLFYLVQNIKKTTLQQEA